MPEEQAWIDENVNHKGVALNIKKVAFVMSKDQIAQIANEQVMEEEFGQKNAIQYFNKQQDAINRIKE